MIKVVNSMLEEKVVGAEKYMRPICLGTASASISTTKTKKKNLLSNKQNDYGKACVSYCYEIP